LQSFLDKLPVNGNSSLSQRTTVLAFHYEDGIIVAGDRRIMAGSTWCLRDAKRLFRSMTIHLWLWQECQPLRLRYHE
jgi:hypothetical protein